jgi:hypothetical protein
MKIKKFEGDKGTDLLKRAVGIMNSKTSTSDAADDIMDELTDLPNGT